MTSDHIARQELARNHPLVFNGVEIHDRSELLCLTDMWKAQGSDPAQQPANWLVSAEAKNFISALNDLNPGNSGVIAKKGKNGGTYAHWQIGLAYAKYLSPEFHMWCNTVVRERMEGKPAGTLPADVRELIERTNGMCRMLAHKVTEVEATVHRLEATHTAPTFDLAGTVTSDQIIELAGVLRADRVRGTTVMITNAMLDFCDGSGCFRTPSDLNPARPWRFPRDRAREWLFGASYGAERIRNQITVQKRKKDKKGQRSLHLVPPNNPVA